MRSILFPRQALYAHRLVLRHSEDNRLLRFEAPVPSDFAKLLGRLRHETVERARADTLASRTRQV